MADLLRQQSHKKLHFYSATSILVFFLFFIIIFTLILTVLFSSERSIPFILSPSSFLTQFSVSKSAPQIRFSEIEADSEHGSEKRENVSKIAEISQGFGEIGPTSSVSLLTQISVSERDAEIPVSEIDGVLTDSEPGSEKRGNGTKNVPDSEGVLGQLGFKFEDQKEENGSRVFVSIKTNDKLGFEFESESREVKVKKSCNLYTGKWVRDDDGYPVYQPGSCPFVDEAFNCQTNGRPDSRYLNWRWKPDDCDLPRFNATDFLDRVRGKRLMFVGDSVNRNQFESMLCLLYQGLPDKTKMFEVHGYRITKGRGFYIFNFLDFNCTVGFVRSHFLVREGTRTKGKGKSNPTLSIDKIDKTAKKWKQADILIFNTGHWWTHGKTSRGKNYFKEGDYIYPEFDAVEAYRRAMKTWANWVDKNVNPARQLVFYRAYSPSHFRGGDWDSGGTCNGETEPVLGGKFLDIYPTKMKIVEEVTREMKVPVVLLNITKLTSLRKDGHPSIYGKARSSSTKVSSRKEDCSHWCLPGVPDAWNELVYASLIFQQTAIDRL